MAIVGSRKCGNFTVSTILPYIPVNITELVSGGAHGVDYFANAAAEILNIKMICFLPEYSKFGKAAPLIRNRQICDYADCVLAFWDMKSKGTRSVISYCLKQRIPVRVIPMISQI